MAGQHRGQTIAPPRRVVSPGNCAPEWRWAWGGLRGAWLFDEAGGEVVYDRSGYGTHISYRDGLGTASLDWQAGPFGFGQQCTPANADMLQGAQDPQLDITGAITVLVRLRKDSSWNDGAVICQFGGSNHDTSPWGIRVWFGNHISWTHNDSFTTYRIAQIDRSNFTVGQMHTLAFTRDAGLSVNGYVDGVHLGGPETDTLGGGVTSTMGLGIGDTRQNTDTSGGFGHPFDGLIDCVLVWARTLTAGEIAAVSRDPYTPFPPGGRSRSRRARPRTSSPAASRRASRSARGSMCAARWQARCRWRSRRAAPSTCGARSLGPCRCCLLTAGASTCAGPSTARWR